jgi:ABC-2 type transport system permease protein
MSAPDQMSAPASPWQRDLGLVAWQVRYEQRAFWRNRGRAFFAFLFPIMFLVIFASLYKGKKLPGSDIPYNDFFVPGILAYGVITTTFVNMAISTAILRDEGVLKRMQGTPLPRWAYMAGRIGSMVLVVAAMTFVVLTLGASVYGVHVRASTLPGLLTALALGTACFTALGIGLVRYIKNAEAAPPIVNIAILPLTFISGVWFPTEGMPRWLREIGEAFPIHALASACQYAFNPHTTGAGFQGGDLRRLAIWLVLGVLLTVRFLRAPLGEDS